MKRQYSRTVLAIAFVALVLFTIPLPTVHASGQPASTNPLTSDSNIPVTYVNAIPPVHQYTITLITGDILYVSKSDKGAWSVAVKEAPRRYGTVPFETFSDSQRGTYAIPADVVSLVPNMLDSYLFNLDYITENHLDDASSSAIGVIAQYALGSPLSGQWSTASVQYSNLSIVNSQALSIPKDGAAVFGSGILSNPLTLPNGIEKIWLDKVATVADDQSLPMIGGDVAQNVLGYNGSGINIAILDTGIDATHPDFFFSNGTSKIIVKVDTTCMAEPRLYCDHTTQDLFGHGTHVASIAAGTGAASGGRYVGVAPGASLMNIKVCNYQGVCYESWILLGLQLAAQGINGVKGDVISMSLGGQPTDGSDPLSQAVNQVVDVYHIPVVIAAGNSGCSFCVSSPGGADDAITVAATTKALSSAVPGIADFSSRGPRLDNFDIKPDIAAPGVGVIAACRVYTGGLGFSCHGSRYIMLSGTSMATPHVSGSVALLLQQARERGIKLTPTEIKNILQSTSNVLPSQPGQADVDIYQQGAGLVRIDHALEANLVFNSSEISFGNVPYATPNIQHTLQIINLGTTPVSVRLLYEMTDVQTPESPLDTGATHNNLVSLSQTNLTIAAGASASVTLTIDVADAPTMKLWNIFSGRIFATTGNTTLAHAIFGFAKEGPRQTAFLTRINPVGAPGLYGGLYDYNYQAISVFDALDPLGFENFNVNVNSSGQATLRLPPSLYNFMVNIIVLRLKYFDGLFYYYDYYYYRIAALEVPVMTSPANVTLDASQAGPVRLNLQADPNAGSIQQDDAADYIRPDGSSVQFGETIFRQSWNGYSVNNAAAKLGTFWTFDRWLDERGSAALYDISMTNHTQQPITHTVNDLSTLAKTYATYYAETPRGGTFGRWSYPMAFNEAVSFAGFYGVAPSQRVEYQQPTEAGYRQFFDPSRRISLFWFESPATFSYFGSYILGRVEAPGETQNETWAAMPVHPKLTSVQRQSDTLMLSGFEVTDNFGHFGVNILNDDGWNFQMSVYVNGTLSAETNQTTSLNSGQDCNPYDCLEESKVSFVSLNVSLPRQSATVEVVMQLKPNRYGSALSTNVTSDIVFVTNPGQQGPIPLPTFNYDVKNISVLNQAQTDNNENVQIKVSLLAPDGTLVRPVDPAAQVALNFGSNWTPASVTILGSAGMLVIAHIPATGHGYEFWVSLRISTLTPHGIAYTQTIITALTAVS